MLVDVASQASTDGRAEAHERPAVAIMAGHRRRDLQRKSNMGVGRSRLLSHVLSLVRRSEVKPRVLTEGESETYAARSSSCPLVSRPPVAVRDRRVGDGADARCAKPPRASDSASDSSRRDVSHRSDAGRIRECRRAGCRRSRSAATGQGTGGGPPPADARERPLRTGAAGA